MRRRSVMALTAAVVGAWAGPAVATAARAAGAAADPQPDGAPPGAPPGLSPRWQLRWAPAACRDGLAAFEHVEDDRANSHPAGQPHIFVEGDHYRFNMHMVDRDTSTDRQRQEVRGMRSSARTLSLLQGETWRFTYSMFIPDTLKATTTFTHIMQMKAPGTGSGPIVVQSLRRYGTVQKIELKIPDSNTLIGAVDLEPLQNHWIDVEFELGIGDATHGGVRWAIRDGATTVIDTTTTGVDTWLFDRVRPKWGIYRSLGDASGSLEDTYMLVRDLRCYQLTAEHRPPSIVRYEAEQARIGQGVVESASGGYSGSGYVNLEGAAGGYVEWTVYGHGSGPGVLNVWYANATTTPRPMDVTVNGVTVASGLVFDRTPAWNDWETRTILVDLRPGPNIVRATATTAAGGPHLDSIEVQQ
jgi:hypothetical protein